MIGTKEHPELQTFMEGLISRNPGETEFHQAVLEVAEDILPFIDEHPEYRQANILERMTEPDRVISFRVCWEDDEGQIRVNRGTRVQFNNSIGPYKGGIRFDPSVTLSVLKFLGFEQTFKNSLTGLPMGGAKGGANFNPKGKSDREVMRFCQAFMTELWRYIGKDTDVPAGDIGVGTREVSYLFGQYKRLQNEFTGALTGKGLAFGGSHLRPEATGYGCVYFASEMLAHRGDGLPKKVCVVSGSGNVAQYTVEKATQMGARVVTMSEREGFIYDRDGIDAEKLDFIITLKNKRRGSLRAYVDQFGGEYHESRQPWHVPCDIAFPSATQNEIGGGEAKALLDNGVIAIAEGANMPCTIDANHVLRGRVLRGPSKAANAGGVAVSGIEQSQNSMRLQWSREEVDRRLQSIIENIHAQCVEYGSGGELIDYSRGANVAGFVKVADAMLAYGVL